MGLSYIPGTPYYEVTIVILAKTYSNSMIAALNSRVKAVSNYPSGFPPSWNEAAQTKESLQGREIVFIGDASEDRMGDTE